LLSRWLVFGGDVFGELSLRFFNFIRKASRGELLPSVEDDPSGLVGALIGFASALWPKPEFGASQ
jgi:hypothetical protein